MRAGTTLKEQTAELEMQALGADGSLVATRGGLDFSFIIDHDEGGQPYPPQPPARDPSITGDLRLWPAARLVEPSSGRAMAVRTNAPALQVHTANNIDANPKVWSGKQGALYQKHGAINLETQNYPNAINTAHFPSPILRPRERYHHIAVHSFELGLLQH
eukprot:COSAG01_NODE_3136_length_6529_cov_6.221617_6_plen_160_part_00